MRKAKRVLIVCPYPEGVAAAQRLKYEQYIKEWEADGYTVVISSFMRMPMWNIVHKKGYTIQKIYYTIAGVIRRSLELFTLKTYDVVYIHMYVTPIGSAFFEKLYRQFSKKVIYDLEDNRFLDAKKDNPDISQRLRSVSKTEFLVTTADHVITSSPALNDFCLGFNLKKKCTYISSSINTDRFVPANDYNNDNVVTIGWTGTFSTRPYLDLLRNVFIELKKQRNFKLIVIGNFEYSFPEMNIEVIQWTLENEVSDLQKIDIGVYPLPMDEWVMGKSGLKAIQYMSFGLPCVCTDISTVQQFIINGENGFLVRTETEWVEALIKLIDDAELRRTVGANARKTVMERFSYDVIKHQYLTILNEVAPV